MKNTLDKITLKGFKTIRDMRDFAPGRLTALIGPNGAGKSNFISFFRMMSWALGARDNLAFYVGQQGGASKLLHNGPSATREIEAELTISTESGENQYGFRLSYAAGDTLVFADEKYRYSSAGACSRSDWYEKGAGHRSPRLLSDADEYQTARVIRDILRRIRVYQFHNTSETARMRTKWRVTDNRYLREDAANIAPMLLRLRDSHSWHYRRIVETARLILPFFSDFELEPDNGHLLLRWRESASGEVFDVSQAADGMLRIIVLVTLLLQPKEDLPDVLILDEPELGLHPYAINVIGGLIGGVSLSTQVILATQSAPLVDCFEPADIVVVERNGNGSTFNRLDSDALSAWLEHYSLSELWAKNVIGGRP